MHLGLHSSPSTFSYLGAGVFNQSWDVPLHAMEGERGMGVERVSQGAIVTRGHGLQGLQREAVCMQRVRWMSQTSPWMEGSLASG